MKKLTAIVIGATGLVGHHLLKKLATDEQFDKIIVLTRREIEVKSSKIENHLIDFNKPEEWGKFVIGDVLFSCLGTTIKKAGSQEAQYLIDYTYQFATAEIASMNNVARYVLISSAGANSKSSIFYSRIKGELEDAVRKLTFKRIAILQSGILDGPRSESRPMERFMIKFARGVNFIPGLKQYRPIHADIVSAAMINCALDHEEGISVYSLEEVFKKGIG